LKYLYVLPVIYTSHLAAEDILAIPMMFSFILQHFVPSKTTRYQVPLLTDINCTRCSAIAERPRCRVRYSFHQK